MSPRELKSIFIDRDSRVNSVKRDWMARITPDGGDARAGDEPATDAMPFGYVL